MATVATGEPSSTPKGGCGCGGTCGGTCPTCAPKLVPESRTSAFAYAVGRIRPNFTTLGLEKEIASAAGQKMTGGESDEEALIELVLDPNYRYLATEVCWTLAIGDVDAYVLRPVGAPGLDSILASLKVDKDSSEVDVVVGRVGPRTGPDECNGRLLPTLIPTQVFSFNRGVLLEALSTNDNIKVELRKSAIRQTLEITGALTGNYGSTDAHRAANYAITRYAGIYEEVAKNLLENWALSGIAARPSALAGTRKVMDVILSFRSRKTDGITKSFIRVDTTDLFPFLVQPMSPYFEMS